MPFKHATGVLFHALFIFGVYIVYMYLESTSAHVHARHMLVHVNVLAVWRACRDLLDHFGGCRHTFNIKNEIYVFFYLLDHKI